MLISARDVSFTASRKENERRRDFFALLQVVAKQSYSPTDVEWRLIDHCLGEVNYKYADFLFLMGFTLALVPRMRQRGSFVSRNLFPLYVGLVGYDAGLRATNPCPAISFWNSVVFLDGPFGETARLIHAPRCFYDVENSWAKIGDEVRRVSFLHWLWDSGSFMANSLFLGAVFRHTFNRSCWRHDIDGCRLTSLVVNCRFFIWNVFTFRSRITGVEGVSSIAMDLPHVVLPLGLVRSYRSRHLILGQSSTGSKLWYSVHFSLVRFFETLNKRHIG
uniref:Uncharacterized protein n=1 Tax=Trypanosoma congolense (strain IL3000) TaxID=1068625 RepID=G0UTQ4_TRYCI|nr:conserved hypothetical protein [Trypanosoma congolense IL3000]